MVVVQKKVPKFYSGDQLLKIATLFKLKWAKFPLSKNNTYKAVSPLIAQQLDFYFAHP